jgi:hypothetical protein
MQLAASEGDRCGDIVWGVSEERSEREGGEKGVRLMVPGKNAV